LLGVGLCVTGGTVREMGPEGGRVEKS